MLTISMAEAMAWVGTFLWPFFRVAALFMAMPVFGSMMLTARIRILAAVVVTLMLMPLIQEVPAVDLFSAEALLITLQQILIGVIMGFTLQIIFMALAVAGENIAMTMGLGFASAVDPQNGVNIPLLSQFLTIVGSLVFLVLDGHLMLISLLAQSFQTMPLVGGGLERDAFWLLVNWAREIFVGAVLVAIPAVTALLTVNLAMGVMTRAAPQLNIFSVGFPVTLLVGVMALYFAMPGLVPIFSRLMASGFTLARQLTGG